MADPIVYSLQPNPHWVIIDNFDRLPKGAAIYTYRSLDPSQFKPAFQDAAGQTPFSQPIIGHDNGTMPPIFWEFDPANPAETYYIRVYDSANTATQQFLWDFDGLPSNGADGGGGTIVTATAVQNLVYNNVFFRNIGAQAGSPSLPLSLTLAPGAHQGFVNDPGNINGPTGPDIIFAKNNTSASDSIDFPTYSPIGTRYIPGLDVSPNTYMTYVCSAPGSVELYKYVQFPIAQGVDNLSSQALTIRFYGVCTSGNNQVILKLRTFYGTGGAPSADDFLTLPTITLGSNFSLWTTATFSGNFTDVTGKTLGTCGNDGLFLQVCLPLNSATNISFTKPEMFLGTVPPEVQYENNDKIDSVINTPRTGDIRITVNSFQPYGWVPMNDGTIANGNPANVAAPSGFARNNIDTFPLYNLLWNAFQANQALAPMYNNAGLGPVAYTDPIIDFNAGNQITLTKAAGRVFAGVSASHLLGTFTGSENHLVTKNEIPDHIHDNPGNPFITSQSGGAYTVGVLGNTAPTTGGINAWGPQTALDLMQPTTFMNVYIKL